MPVVREPVRVAINVMRARVTILGFNIAIITFQIRELEELGGAIALPGLEQSVHVPAATALFLGLALSILAMISFIVCSAFDREGTCDHWTLLAGDLLMYLGLAHTVTGFFDPFLAQLGQVVLSDPAEAGEFAWIRTALAIAGGLPWMMAVYLGPTVALLRSPFGGRTTVALGLGYLSILLLAALVWSRAEQLQLRRLGSEETVSWLGGLLVPLHW